MQLTQRQQETLQSIINTFVPAISKQEHDATLAAFWQRAGSDLPVADEIVRFLGTQPKDVQQQFSQLLNLLDSPALGLIFGGALKPFRALPHDKRSEWLLKWSNSSLDALRGAFHILRKFSTLLFYALPDANGKNINWDAVGYPGPLHSHPARFTDKIPTVQFLPHAEVTCHTLVIGSGAGGGVVATELANAGTDVLVVEKGVYDQGDDFNQLEWPSIKRLYEQSGTLTTADGGIGLLAGNCLGGGTVVNWAGALPTPDYILEEWAKEHDLPQVLSTEFKQSLAAVQQAISANTDVIGELSPQNQNLWDASVKARHLVRHIPQNQVFDLPNFDKREAGYSCFGDRYDAKQSTLTAFMRKANSQNLRIAVRTSVQQLVIKNGMVQAVQAVQYTESGQAVAVTIKPKRVVVSAGSLHTPALLMRSGLSHNQLGKNLYLHPTATATGVYQQRIDPWHGVVMSVTNDQFTRLDGNYGCKIETPPAHIGMVAMVMPWLSGEQHKQLMLKAAHFSTFFVLTRDKFGGSVSVGKNGTPLVHYRLHDYDKNHLLTGLAEAIRLHQLAGATEVKIPHKTAPSFAQHAEATAIKQQLQQLSWRPGDFAMISAHHMGTCRMGGNAATHPVAPNGQFRGVSNLYVADASVFPKCSGVNPMLTIEAVAHFIAQQLKAQP